MFGNQKYKRNGLLLFVIFTIGILAISSSSILIRFSQSNAHSIVIAAYRMLVASIILLPYVLLKNSSEFRSIDRHDLVRFLIAGIFLALHFASWISSLEYTSIASSVVLVTTTPLWVAIFSPILLKEKNNPKIWIGISIAIIGSIIVSNSQSCRINSGFVINCEGLGDLLSGRNFLGNFLALAGAWMIAGYIIVGRRLRNKYSLTFYAFCVYTISAILLVIWATLSGFPFIGFSNTTYMWMILLGIFPQLIGHSTFNWALGYLPASFVSVAFMAEPIGTIILAFLLLNEAPQIGEICGGLLILFGIFLVSLTNYNTINGKNNL